MTAAGRRPVLGPRHAQADRLLGLYAEHELGTVRHETWYPGVTAGFTHIVKSGKPLPPEVLADIDLAGWVVVQIKHSPRYRVHWRTLERAYWERQPVGPRARCAALDVFARVLDATLESREPANPL